ncbi:DUF6185 family protein [Streptomyces cinerochromogenes]|uniref:DUF6185 family protein n=1 Tax=Streptomyces cinerochromogenes TaxID=66422 RepID=A0ABW7B7Z7_9ACTN
MWWGCPSAAARHDHTEKCWEKQLESSRVHAVLQLDQHDKESLKLHSSMTIYMPRRVPLSTPLLSGASSSDYLHAMRCLLRGKDNSVHGKEWRINDPQVTISGDDVQVSYDSFAWIRDYEPIQLGPWQIKWKEGRTWTASLHPQALEKSHWGVDADLGGLSFKDTWKFASPANGKLEWKGRPPSQVRFDFDLPWQRWWLLSYGRSFWSKVGVAAWWVCGSVVIALAALRGRQTHPRPVGDGRGDSVGQAVLQWAVLSGSIAVMLILTRSQALRPPWIALIWIPAGLALTLVARPWLGGQRLQARAVKGVTFCVAAIGLLVILAPALFNLPPNLVPNEEPSISGKIGYVLVGLATVWLWLSAMTAWAWRFAREGQLVPTAWTGGWDKAPIRWVAVVSVLLLAAAGGLLGCLWWVSENQWERTSWPVGQDAGSGHGAYVVTYLSGFSFTHLTLIFSYSWVLTGIALLALLHFRTKTRQEVDAKRERSALGPEGADVLLTAAVFAFTAGLQGAAFAGNVGQYPVWLLLNIGSLFAALAAGRRWSVLSRLGDGFRLKRLSRRKRRQELRDKAHDYRNLDNQAQLLTQGRAASLTQDQVEAQQRDLRQWLVSECGKRNPPPERMSLMDIALAWGPEGHWWDNAVHAARIAFFFGVPGSAGVLYLELMDRWKYMKLTHEPTAIPEMVLKFLACQVAWAAAGFTLGALWRLLPGRQSPARGGSLVLAYAVPACLAVLLNIFTGGNFVDLLLYSLFMAVVLTGTSIWMDTETFREDQLYVHGRFALLVSIYRFRGFAGHLAWLLAQLVAATALWEHLAR